MLWTSVRKTEKESGGTTPSKTPVGGSMASSKIHTMISLGRTRTVRMRTSQREFRQRSGPPWAWKPSKPCWKRSPPRPKKKVICPSGCPKTFQSQRLSMNKRSLPTSCTAHIADQAALEIKIDSMGTTTTRAHHQGHSHAINQGHLGT